MGAALYLTACLAQAASLVPPWCGKPDVQNAALSSDRKWILSADELPQSLALFNAALERVKRYQTTTLDHASHSRVAAIYDAPPRHSFIATLPDIAEIWEISYDPKAEPIYDGLVHDYQMGEGLAQPGYLGVRRTKLTTPLVTLNFTQDYRSVIGIIGSAKDDAPLQAHVVNLDIRREIATISLPALPDPATDWIISSGYTTWRAIAGSHLQAAARAGLEAYCTP